MRNLTINQLADIIGGAYIGHNGALDKKVRGIKDRTGKIREGDVYFPERMKKELLTGAYQRLEGIPQCICSVIDKEMLGGSPGGVTPYILVDDYTDAVGKLVSSLRPMVTEPIISITGSVGKTCTTGMVSQVLSQQYKTYKSNYYENVPWNYHEPIYEMYKGKYEVGVFEAAEMTAERYGDFSPDFMVATNVGEAHIEDFSNRDRIFKVMLDMIETVRPTGRCYVDGCDDYLKSVALDKPRGIKMFGMSHELEYHPENIINYGIKGVNCDLVHCKDRVNVTIPVPGLHFVNAALISFAIGLEFGVSLEKIKAGIENYKTAKLRSKVYETGFISIIEDTYNSSPKSVKAAADTLSALDGRKVMIWGDMLKLGEHTEKMHEETLRHIANSKVDVLISVGAKGVSSMRDAVSVRAGVSIMKTIESTNDKRLEFIRLPDQLELLDTLERVVKKGDSIFVKGDADVNKSFHKAVLALLEYDDLRHS